MDPMDTAKIVLKHKEKNSDIIMTRNFGKNASSGLLNRQDHEMNT